ncbi:MAG: hypothetical protein GXP62_05915 [Oligoflexia bacterium]|nr:hypothetical protein [Oligoflexia bacterium]
MPDARHRTGTDDQADPSTEELARAEGLKFGLSRATRLLILSAILVVVLIIARSCA